MPPPDNQQYDVLEKICVGISIRQMKKLWKRNGPNLHVPCLIAVEARQTIKEPAAPEDAGVLAAIKHLMQRYMEEKDYLLGCLAGEVLAFC